jgi:hypothetical protein
VRLEATNRNVEVFLFRIEQGTGYVGNSPCSSVDLLGMATCTFNIKVNGNFLNVNQLNAIEARINQVLGSAQSDEGDSVQARFSFTGQADFQLNISSSVNSRADGWSGWPGSSPTIWWGNFSTWPNATTYAGTLATHEITHRGPGPPVGSLGSLQRHPKSHEREPGDERWTWRRSDYGLVRPQRRSGLRIPQRGTST